MSPRESVAYAEWLRRRTQNCLAVAYRWEAVTVLAEAVTARKRLCGRAVRDLISGL